MDFLAEHEAFLRAIFDAPDDDTPRLVYADFLQENGDEERAQFVRWQCGRGEKPERFPVVSEIWKYVRGFPDGSTSMALSFDRLTDPTSFREYAVRMSPECFATERLSVHGGRINSVEPFDTLFSLAAFARVTELVLAGEEVAEDANFGVVTFYFKPVITPAGVAALAQHRGLRRITELDLRNNDLDNDAARALVKSPYLDNLKRLQLLEGNRLRGKVWQQVIERFGEDVVG